MLVCLTISAPTYGQSTADEVIAQTSGGYYLAGASSTRGRELFVNKGCVVCHSVNGAGGEVGPSLDVDPSNQTIDVFGFLARMWRGAEAMIALQRREVGFPIELSGQELAHLARFLHDYEAQKTFSDKEIPAIVRKLLEAEKLKELDL
jgi:mono/diheme cytochrome c family protein